MQETQKVLQEKNKDIREAIGPETGQNKFLWTVNERVCNNIF